MRIVVLVSVLFFFFLVSCKKDPEINPNPNQWNKCKLFDKISLDTNYMPHKIGNSWTYSFCDLNYANWEVWIKADTLIGGNKFLTIGHYTSSTHAPVSGYDSFSMIDSSGNYYEICQNDTILLVKSNGVNGDTLYNNSVSKIKTVLINKHEAVGSLSDCYHCRVIFPGYTEEHYFKRGIGDLFSGAAILTDAKIN